MEGLHLGNDNSCIEKVNQGAGDLSLLAKGGETEVMFQNIKAEEYFCIEPAPNSEVMEFFYLIDGSISYNCEGKTITLNKGDYFYVHNLKETAHFKTLCNCKLLYVSNQPIFQYLSARIRDLVKMVDKVEEKDIYTYNHGKRVKDYSMKIGKKLGISKERLEILGFASLCHDVGKINVPDEILNKPGKLTDEEMKCIRKHPIDGALMVKDTFFYMASDIIRQHHERLDGSGYPFGLKADDILLEAKIISVADTYDAMTTDRVYRKKLDVIVAINELEKYKGIKYDKTVIDVFERILKEEGILK